MTALLGFASVLVAAAIAGCFPNPDALRPKPSSGSGGSASGSGGSTGSGGTAGSAGHAGIGGAGGAGSGGAGGTGSGGHAGTGGSTTGTGGSTTGAGGAGGAAGYTGSGLALTPDATGFIAANSNAFGVTGSWYVFSDGVGPDGATSTGSCETAGHPPSACSMVNTPPPGSPGFSNIGGRMCVTGVAARVVNNTTSGQPDFGAIYGATVGFDFNYPAIAPPKGTFNALGNQITGIQFDIDLVPANGLRVQFVTPGTDLGAGGPSYWGGSPAFPPSPVFIGTNRIYWADVSGPYGLGLDPTKLVSMYFNVPTQTASADVFQFCISNVTLIRDGGPLGRTCTDVTHPIYCPALNSVPANCWTPGTNCNTVTNCGDTYASCTGQAQNEIVDCAQLQCMICGGTTPMSCPGLGTVPSQCWPANTACSTVTNCGGGLYLGCNDPSLVVDCVNSSCG